MKFGATASSALNVVAFLVKAGRRLFGKRAYDRAIAATEAQFYPIRAEIRPAIEKWRQDDRVSAFLKAIQDGTAPPIIKNELVEVFNERTGRRLSPETAEEILLFFVRQFQKERHADPDGLWVQTEAIRTPILQLSKHLTPRESDEDAIAPIPRRPSELHSGSARAIEAVGVGTESAGIHDSEPIDRNEQEWHRRLDDARDLIDEGSPRSALALLSRIEQDLGDRSVSPRIRYRLAMNFGAALVGTGQHQLAAVRYRQALDYAPNDEIATGQVAQVEFNCGNIEEAERLARRLVENNPDVAVGWAVLIRAANVDPEQVPDSLREHPAVLMARGLVALRAGKPPDAVDAFRRALQHGSRDPQVLVLLAEALTLASRDERSLKNE